MDIAEPCPKCEKAMIKYELFEDQPIKLQCNHNLCFSCCCFNNYPQDDFKVFCPICNDNKKTERQKDEKRIKFYT